MQPANTLHLGSDLGALTNRAKLQEKMPCIYCVVDMHASAAGASYTKPKEPAWVFNCALLGQTILKIVRGEVWPDKLITNSLFATVDRPALPGAVSSVR